MTPIVDRLQLLLTFISMSKAMECQQYRANLDVDNKVSSQAPSDNLHAVSFATCSRSCINGCECFSFNSQSMMCRLYMFNSSCDPSNLTVSEAGWRSYTIFEIQPTGTISVYLSFINDAMISKYLFWTPWYLIKQSVLSLFISFWIVSLFTLICPYVLWSNISILFIYLKQ